MMGTRIVIDTSVVVSALIGAQGPAREVLRQGLEGRFVPLISTPLFQEYQSLVSRPDILAQCPLQAGEIQTLMNAWYDCCQWIRIYYLGRPNLPDEDDNFLFELAMAGNAELILTQNLRDMAPELAFPRIRVLTPARYLQEVST